MINKIKLVSVCSLLTITTGCVQPYTNTYSSYTPTSTSSKYSYEKNEYDQEDENINSVRRILNEIISLDEKLNNKYKNTNDRFDKLHITESKFAPVYKASKNVLAGIENGISYSDFSAVTNPFFAEISIIKDTAKTSDDKFLADVYSDAADRLSLTKEYWSSELKLSTKSKTSSGLIKESFSEIKKLLDKANTAYISNYENKKPQKISKNKK